MAGRARLQGAEIFEVSLERLAHAPPERIQHDAAAERAQAGLVADDEAIARQRDHRIVQARAAPAQLLGCDFARRLEHDRAADSLGGAEEEAHAVIVLERAFGGRPNLEPRIEPRGRQFEPVIGQHVAALEFHPLGAAQVERDALAEPRALDRLGMDLDRAHPDLAARGQHAQLLADAHLGAHRGAGHDRAVALDR